MFYSVDTNVLTRAACYCQIPGLGESIGADKRAHLCHNAIQKLQSIAPEKEQRVISAKVLSESRNHINGIIWVNFQDFLALPGKAEKVALAENKQKDYNVMSFYKNQCLFKLRMLKNHFKKIQYDTQHDFGKVMQQIEKAIQQVLDSFDSSASVTSRLHEYAAIIASTSEFFRQSAIEAIRVNNERIYAQIYHHRRRPISRSDLHILADLFLFLQENRKRTKPECTLITMDKHLSPYLDRDGQRILSDPITRMYASLFNITCIHPWHFLST